MENGILPAGFHQGWLAPTLVVAVAVFWFLPRTRQDAFLAIASFGCVAAIAPIGAVVLLALSLLFFLVAPRARGDGPLARWIPAILVLLVLGHLAWHKYVPPFLGERAPGGGPLDLAIPLGISYYTFKLIHYAVETSRGNVTDRSLWRFLGYVFLMTTFTAGPIERYDHYLAEREPRWSLDSAVAGTTRILHGLVKKFVLAAAAWSVFRSAGGEHLAANLDVFSPWRVWGYCGLMYVYVYLDFSAYSDLAIGASRLFGIRIMENFRWPILAPNIGAFWQRWHMTLSGWCRTYVYMPAIGLTRNPYVAVYATFLAIGLWHAGAFRFALWGLYHATGVAIFQTWRRLSRGRRPAFLDRWPARWIGVPMTFLFVTSSFALTIAGTRGTAVDGLRIFARLFGIET